MTEMYRYAWILTLISLVLVLIGWQVVYYNARRIATRSESKAAVDHLIKIINEISDTGITFWLSMDSTSDSHNRYALIVMGKVTQAYEFISIIQRRGVSISDDFLSEISQAATLDCELAHGLAIDLKAEKAQNVINCCMEMISHVFEKFEECHPAIKDETLEEWSRRLGPHSQEQYILTIKK